MNKFENCGIQLDARKLLALLGPSLYKGDIGTIGIKELFQNAFDACKKQSDAQIDITVSHRENYVRVVDNGCGMSPETVKNVYLTIGGSLKDNLDVSERSGGFGIAKVQFIMAAHRIVVDTVKDGVRTILDADQLSLLDGKATITFSDTDQHNGTSVTLYYPTREIAEKIEGLKEVRLSHWAPTAIECPRPRYDHVKVTFNGNPVNVTLQDFLESERIGVSEFDFPTWTATVYWAPKISTYAYGYTITSAGVYQFKTCIDAMSQSLKMKAFIDVRSKVPASHEGYPFNNQREGFRPSVQNDVDILAQNMLLMEQSMMSDIIRQRYERMMGLSYQSVEGTARPQDKGRTIEVSEEIFNLIAEEFKRQSEVVKDSEAVKTTHARVSKTVEDFIKSDRLKLTNLTTREYQGGYQLFSEVASVCYDAYMLLPEEMKSNPRFPVVVGIGIRKGVGGWNINTPTLRGIFINPLSCSWPAMADCWIEHIIGIWIHELTHVFEEYHDERFCSRYQENSVLITKLGIRRTLEDKLRTIFFAHMQDIVNLSKEFFDSESIDPED